MLACSAKCTPFSLPSLIFPSFYLPRFSAPDALRLCRTDEYYHQHYYCYYCHHDRKPEMETEAASNGRHQFPEASRTSSAWHTNPTSTAAPYHGNLYSISKLECLKLLTSRKFKQRTTSARELRCWGRWPGCTDGWRGLSSSREDEHRLGARTGGTRWDVSTTAATAITTIVIRADGSLYCLEGCAESSAEEGNGLRYKSPSADYSFWPGCIQFAPMVNEIHLYPVE